MVLCQLVGGLEKDDEVGIEGAELTRRIQELAFHLIIFGFEEVEEEAMQATCSSEGGSQKLSGGVAHEGHLQW